jgi:hypothetical protein
MHQPSRRASSEQQETSPGRLKGLWVLGSGSNGSPCTTWRTVYGRWRSPPQTRATCPQSQGRDTLSASTWPSTATTSVWHPSTRPLMSARRCSHASAAVHARHLLRGHPWLTALLTAHSASARANAWQRLHCHAAPAWPLAAALQHGRDSVQVCGSYFG